MQDAVWAVVVARVGNGAKSRLASVLEPEERRRLALSMLRDVLEACARSRDVLDGLIAVVDDPSARWLAESRGAICLDDPVPGSMNAAAAAGVDAALARGASTVVILPGDIPRVSHADFLELLSAADDAPRAIVVGASRDGGGTNALLLRPPDVIAPAFGPPSVARHVRLARAAGAVPCVLTGLDLAFDVDTTADFAELIRVGATS